MARFTDLQEELSSIDVFIDELSELHEAGVLDQDAVSRGREHYEARRKEIESMLEGVKGGLSRSAVTRSSTVPIIAWIGIALFVAAAIVAAASVWDSVGSYGRLAMLALPAAGCYVAAHLLSRRPDTKRLGFVILAGANILLISTLVYIANEWDLGREEYWGQDVGFVISSFTVGLAAFWARRLNSNIYRIVAIIALTVALLVGNGLVYVQETQELNRRDEQFWQQWEKDHPFDEKQAQEGTWVDPYDTAEGKALMQEREDLNRRESSTGSGIIVLAGVLLVLFGGKVLRTRDQWVASPYLFGGTLMVIGALVSLNPEIIPGELDGFIPLLASLAILWYGLRSQQAPITLAAIVGFFPPLSGHCPSS